MRRAVALVGFTALVAALSLSFLLAPDIRTRAAHEPSATYLIPSGEGYGIAHCLVDGASCGVTVANAWCESQGYARAERFGAFDEDMVTGSVASGAPAARRRSPTVSITCVD